MFGYTLRHDEAREWDGRSTRSGTITFSDDERIEQYVGQQQWIAYSQTDLDNPGFVLGDQVRIAARDGRVHIVAVGPNRLAGEPSAYTAAVRSGILLLRTLAFEGAEIAAAARTTAERYGASLWEDGERIKLAFSGGATLVVTPFAVEAALTAIEIVADLVSHSFNAAVRLDVEVAANLPNSALEAECALIYCAALIAALGDAVAIDDTWAVFSAEQLNELAVREGTRADLYGLAAAAAQSAWPAQTNWYSERRGVFDELTVYSSRPWRADLTAAFLKRLLDAFSHATLRTNDPIVPGQGVLYSSEELGEAGNLQQLLSLTYETVELDVTFIDANLADGMLRAKINGRNDVSALLGSDIAHAIIISFGNRHDTERDQFSLEMQRADTLATALAASIARRTNGIAVDAAGAVYGVDDLVELALQRRGKAASWNARVASAINVRS